MKPIVHTFHLLFTLFVLCACSPHTRQSVTLPGTLPEKFSERIQHVDATERIPERWWEVFRDEHLNALMDETFHGNLDLRQTLARLEQAEAVLGITEAARYPVFTLDASGGRTRQTSPSGPATSNAYRLSASAVFELDLWEKLKSRTDAARSDLFAVTDNAEALYLTLSARVADLYYLAVEQRAQLALTDRIIAAASDTVELVERRYREGLVPAVDVYQSRQNLASARSRRPQFEATLATAEHALSLLAGHFPAVETRDSAKDLPMPIDLSTLPLPSRLLERRPDIRGALARLEGSDARIAAAVADRFPAFSLVGSYGGASDDLSSLLNSGNIFWSLLLNLTQLLIDGGRRSAEVDRQRALFRENLARYHQTVLLAFKEVEDALVQGRATAERLTALDLRAEASQQSLRLAVDRYRQGLSDYLPVLTSQGLAFDAESQLLATHRQLIADRISLARALGGEWMTDELNRHRTERRNKESL